MRPMQRSADLYSSLRNLVCCGRQNTTAVSSIKLQTEPKKRLMKPVDFRRRYSLSIMCKKLLCLMRSKIRLSYIVFPSNLHLQLFCWLSNVLPRRLESLLHFCDFLLDLTTAFRLIHLLEKMVPILEDFFFRRECDDIIPNLIALQLIPADLIIHDCRVESIKQTP